MPTETTTTLNILFSGLCLFARDDYPRPDDHGPADARLHVLLPAFGTDEPPPQEQQQRQQHQHGAHGASPDAAPHPRHLAVLMYAAPYDRSDDPCGDGHPLCCRSLTGYALDVVGGAPGEIGALPKALPDIAKVAGGTPGVDAVARVYVDPGSERRPELAARVTLRSGRGEAIAPDSLAEWTNQCGSQRPPHTFKGTLTNRMVWTVEDLPPGPLTLRLRALPGETGGETIVLTPVDGEVNLLILNLPEADIPPADPRDPADLGPDFPADHYHGFYALFPDAAQHVVPCLTTSITTPQVLSSSVSSRCKPAPEEGAASGAAGAPHAPLAALGPFTVFDRLKRLCPEVVTCVGGSGHVAPA
jgi:hypothetical protein